MFDYTDANPFSTALPAPTRTSSPTGRRSEAPAPTCTGRQAADYYATLTELEAFPSIWCCSDEDAEARLADVLGVEGGGR